MRAITRLLLTLTLSALSSSVVLATTIDDISKTERSKGLKEALTQGANAAVKRLGKTDGFLGNPKVKIPLPANLQKIEKLLRNFGMGKQADELVVTMNRAAESAVQEAKPLLVDAVKKMSVQDAKSILMGSDDAATQYFKRTTSASLTQKFLPVVKKATAKVELAGKYNHFAEQAQKYHLIDESQATFEKYITQKTLDGLYLMIAEEERAIRKDPLGQGSNILRKVFGSLAN